jgi:methyl-accepting chemotaxis protein
LVAKSFDDLGEFTMQLKSLRAKSSIPPAILAITLIFTLVMSVRIISMERAGLEDQSNVFQSAISLVLNADRDLYQAKVAAMNLVFKVADPAEQEQDRVDNAQQVNDRFQKYRSVLKAYPALIKQFDHFDTVFDEWKALSDQLVKPGANVSALMPKEEAAFGALRDILDVAGEAAMVAAKERKEQVTKTVDSLLMVSIVILIIALLLSGFLAYQIPKALSKQIQLLNHRVIDLSQGEADLTTRLPDDSNDEFGELARSFNSFLKQLQGMVGSIKQQALELSQLTSDLSRASNETGSITSQLNLASDTIVSSVHEMTLSNKEMANVATQTSGEAEDSMQQAKSGMVVVDKSSRAILSLSSNMDTALSCSQELENSSEQIASVLDVIRGIAEQTNLLALNAAIEAARAGEQGRGFAVVADEVRTLATRTQDSTNDIQGMIEQLKVRVNQSANAIQSGKTNADETVQIFSEVKNMLDSIQGSSLRVNEMSTQTAQATAEQSSVADEISSSLNGLNQQSLNASKVAENCLSISTRIKEQVNQLESVTRRFTV